MRNFRTKKHVKFRFVMIRVYLLLFCFSLLLALGISKQAYYVVCQEIYTEIKILEMKYRSQIQNICNYLILGV